MVSKGNAHGVEVAVAVAVEAHRRRTTTATVSAATEMETENLEAVPGTKDPTTIEMIGRRSEIGVVVDGGSDSISSYVPPLPHFYFKASILYCILRREKDDEAESID
jgi:hypothetical protein